MGSPQSEEDRPLLPQALDRGAWVRPAMGSRGIWDAHGRRPITAAALPPVRCNGWRLRITSLPERPPTPESEPDFQLPARHSPSALAWSCSLPGSSLRACDVLQVPAVGASALICGPWPPRNSARHRCDGIVGVGKHLCSWVPRALMAFSFPSSTWPLLDNTVSFLEDALASLRSSRPTSSRPGLSRPQMA